MTTALKLCPAPNPAREGDTPLALLVGAKDLAAMLGISVRHLRRLDAGEELPRPLALGKRVLWRADEIRRWIDAGCPARNAWESLSRSYRHQRKDAAL